MASSRQAVRLAIFVLLVTVLGSVAVPAADKKSSAWTNLEQVCRELQIATNEGAFSPSLSLRYQLLTFYAHSLGEDDENKDFSIAQVLEFAADSRDLTLVSEPSQPIRNGLRAMDGFLIEIARGKNVSFRAAKEEQFLVQLPIPPDPVARGGELHAIVKLVVEKSTALRQRGVIDVRTPQGARMDADLAGLQGAAAQFLMAMEQGGLSEANFQQLQAARARWELSRAGLEITGRVAGEELVKLCRSSAELWRAGQ